MDTSASAGHRTASIIAAALAGGVALFWGVAWFLVEASGGPGDPGVLTSRLTLWIWGALALPAFAVSLLFTRSARSLATEARRRGLGMGPSSGGDGGAGTIQTRLIIAWALLEGPALLAGVFFLLNGSRTLLAAAATVYFIGVAVTFPRRSWFPADGRPGAPPRGAGGSDAA